MKKVCINEKLWDEHNLSFPVNEDIVYLVGSNGSGKTHVLNHLKNYFEKNGEKVIYFTDERFFLLNPEKTKELLLKNKKSLRALLGVKDARGNSFVQDYEIEIENLFLEKKVGKYMNQGKMQVVNFFSTILFEEKEVIVLIDEPERHLDIETQSHLVNDIFSLKNVKKVIVATHSPSIIEDSFDKAIDVKTLYDTKKEA